MRGSPKIRTLEALAPVLARARSRNKRIVLCHGVFDLLHLGHIRYFENARKLGDILVVTVTADRYVNKGPMRPAFTEEMRAEAVAALDCVDHVAINQWPMAVEAIKKLKPHYYVKGAEYKDAAKDHTKGITMEEEAIKSVGGKIAFTQDITFSASHLIKRYLPVFTKEVSEYLAGFASRYVSDEVLGYLKGAGKLKVLAIGEAIIDDYRYCEAIGKSSKEPMLAVRHLTAEKFNGGILAVGNHAANFCAQTGLVTFLGDRDSQEDFIVDNLNAKIRRHFLRRKNSPTIVKRRYIEQYFFTKLIEVYEMNSNALDPEEDKELCRVLKAEIPRYDVVIVVDFGHGMLSDKAVKIICDKSKFLAVNAQTNADNLGYQTIGRYPRADYIAMAEKEFRLEARDRRGDLRKIVLEAIKGIKCDRIIATRGKFGCLAYDKKAGFFEVPALAGQVVDRMGAGDAFLSVTAPCVAQKAPLEVVGFIGNAVGAQAVATVGNRSAIEPVALFKNIESLMK
ncbi:MAG: adenylyltransferase/cytidyltransferase family protein [Elusimicrobia bacterium]|nr:adenylyltransferase/cytidyltransferase family protein [Elusimicrobiota bacterium]